MVSLRSYAMVNKRATLKDSTIVALDALDELRDQIELTYRYSELANETNIINSAKSETIFQLIDQTMNQLIILARKNNKLIANNKWNI